MKDDGSAAHHLELRQRVVAIARLPDRDAVAGGHLVATDDERIRMRRCNGVRLGLGEPNRCGGGKLSLPHGLIDLRRDEAEGQPEPFQKRPAIAGR